MPGRPGPQTGTIIDLTDKETDKKLIGESMEALKRRLALAWKELKRLEELLRGDDVN